MGLQNPILDDIERKQVKGCKHVQRMIRQHMDQTSAGVDDSWKEEEGRAEI
jgi:hypothetical protein